MDMLNWFRRTENLTSYKLDYVGGHFIGDYMSLLTGVSTPLEIKTLDASTVYRISRDNYMQLGQTDIGNTLMRIAAESSFISKQQQIDLLTKSAKQRYEELSLQFPHIEMRVAQKYLASYLGITPQSLSRLRKQV
jgi:DNA polymerase elongation subunit (family B)